MHRDAAAGVPAQPGARRIARPFLRPALAGAAATASGNGIARFAYVPLFPAMVSAGWVDGAEAGLLGAAALLGYLIGTLAGRGAGLRLGVPRTLDCGMAIIVLSLAACALDGGFWWFMAWRTLAGIGGGLLMALAGPATQASVAAGQRGIAGGVVLAGVGSGIATGALAVPALLGLGLSATWLGLALLVLLLWGFAHPRWPDMALAATPGAARVPAVRRHRARLLVAAYGLHAAGMVPPMVYLADLAARGRGLGVGVGAAIWFVFGLGAVIGSVASGRLVDRLGGMPVLILWLLAQAAALLLALPPLAALVWPAALLAGFAAVGTTSVTLSVSREFTGTPAEATALWVHATAAFAVMQTALGFALAGLFAATNESHAAVFGAGLVFCLASLAVAAALARRGAA